MLGDKVWQAHPALSRPMTILGIERRWFLLSLTLALAMWNAIGSLVAGALVGGVLGVAGWFAGRKDPAMLAIVVAAGKTAKNRYDPGKEAGWVVECS